MRASWMRWTIDAIDALADGGQRDRQRVHREAGVDAGAEHRDLRLLRQRVNSAARAGCACSPDTTAPRSSRRSARLRLQHRLDLRHHLLDRRAGAQHDDVAASPPSASWPRRADTFTPRRFGSPTTSPRSRPTLAGSMSMAPTILKPGRAATCLTMAAPIGPSPKCMTRMFGIDLRIIARGSVVRCAAGCQDHPRVRLTRDHVVWAYRLLLDRDPENEDVIGPKLAGSRDTAELRHHLMTSAEFQRQESRLRAHQRSDGRHQGARPRRPAVRRSVRSRDRPEHRARPLRARTRSAFVRGVLKPGDTAIDAGAHIGFFTMQMAAMVGAGGRVYAFEPFDAERRSARAVDSREPVRRSRRLPARGGRRGRRNGDADVPGRDAELGRRVPAARRHARRSPGNRKKSVPRRRARRR